MGFIDERHQFFRSCIIQIICYNDYTNVEFSGILTMDRTMPESITWQKEDEQGPGLPRQTTKDNGFK